MNKVGITTLFLISMILFGVGIYLTLCTEKSASLVVTQFTFGTILLVFIYPRTFDSISFFGFKAKLRELETEQNKFKRLAESNTRAFFELLQIQMRFSGPQIEEEKNRIFDDLNSTLKAIGLEEKEIAAVQDRWHYWVIRDYKAYILELAEKNAISKLDDEQEKKRLREKRRDLIENTGTTAGQMRSFFLECGIKSDFVDQLIEDFDFYCKNKTHQSFEQWKNRSSWNKQPIGS